MFEVAGMEMVLGGQESARPDALDQNGRGQRDCTLLELGGEVGGAAGASLRCGPIELSSNARVDAAAGERLVARALLEVGCRCGQTGVDTAPLLGGRSLVDRSGEQRVREAHRSVLAGRHDPGALCGSRRRRA